MGEACRGFGRAVLRVGRGHDVSPPVAAARAGRVGRRGRSVGATPVHRSAAPPLRPAGAPARRAPDATAAGGGASAGDDPRAVGPGEPPPRLARRYPSQDDPLTLDAAPIDYRLPLPPGSKPATRIHKIVDGDTLAGLAEYYLGSADRQREMYEMNRQALSSPAALPIGVELRIPPRSIESDPADDDPPEHDPVGASPGARRRLNEMDSVGQSTSRRTTQCDHLEVAQRRT